MSEWPKPRIMAGEHEVQGREGVAKRAVFLYSKYTYIATHQACI